MSHRLQAQVVVDKCPAAEIGLYRFLVNFRAHLAVVSFVGAVRRGSLVQKEDYCFLV